MPWLRIPFAAALLLSVAAGPSQAQPRAAGQWQVDWGHYYCSMIPSVGEDSRYSIAILTIPGGDYTSILLLPNGSALFPSGISSVVLGPAGRSFDVTVRRERRGNREVLNISGLPYDFRDALAAAGELQLRARAEVRARFPLGDARAAVAEHRRCTAEISREWSMDEAALATLRRRPATTNLFGLSTNDYPPAALRTATQGRVIVRVDVSAEGRATDCAPVATSGSGEIDATTCRVILRRARFRPALDATGAPVAVRFVSTVTWLLPVPY